jgi:ligand-binding sensor domain-containing protein
MLRSEDDGATWTVISSGMSARTSTLATLHVPASAPSTLLTSGSPWLWESTDEGLSFAENFAGQVDENDNWHIRTIETDLPRVWTGTGTRLWYSNNGGASFVQQTIAGSDRGVYDFMLASNGDWGVATDDGVFVSTNGGASYAAAAMSVPVPEVFGLVELADGPVVAWTDDGLFTRTAAIWSRSGFAGAAVFEVLVHGERWFAATEAGVFYTDDRGDAWTYLPGLSKRRPRTLLIDGSNRLLVGTEGYGMFRTPLP